MSVAIGRYCRFAAGGKSKIYCDAIGLNWLLKYNLLQLPIKIDIIKHKKETDGKSTAVHAAILASDDVSIYTYPDIPDYENEHDTTVAKT